MSGHLSFPFRIGSNGRTAQVNSLEEHVHDELIQLLLTNLGERAFLPEFGGGLRQLVFEPTDPATKGITKAQITQAIETWLGQRVQLENLIVEANNNIIEVEIQYRLVATEESRVMRFQRKGDAVL